MTKKTTCRVRLPPVADKATAARTETKALMRGLLEEMGVPTLVGTVERQRAELCRIREAHWHLRQRLYGILHSDLERKGEITEVLLETLDIMGHGGQEQNMADETDPLPDIVAHGGALTQEQSQEFVRHLTDDTPSMLDRLLGETPENIQTTRRIGFGSRILRESDVTAPDLEQRDTAADHVSTAGFVPSPFVSSPSEGDDETEDPIGDLEM